MPKKVRKKIFIQVPAREQGYWVKKENRKPNERTLKTKEEKVLVKRKRKGYNYAKVITGYEWSKEELRKKLAERAKQGLVQQKAILRDMTHTHKNTKRAPIITAEGFFNNKNWNEMDIYGIDTPPKMTYEEIQKLYKHEGKKKTEKQKKTMLPSQIASESDISMQTAIDAYRNVSWSPERRGESIRRNYAEHINSFYEELKKQVPPEKHKELLEELERYKEKYKAKLEEQLYRLSRIASSAVVGRSNFPTSTMRKRNEIYDRKESEFYAWDEKVRRAIRKKFGLIKGGGISSDDPEAIRKIEQRVAKLKARHEHMKKVNKIVRSKKMSKEEKLKQLEVLGYNRLDAEQLFKEDFLGRNAYPDYELSNNLANIRRLEKRIEELREIREKPTTSKTYAGVKIEENTTDNRLRIFFDAIPEPEIRAELKSRGFRWSPKNKAWQRMISNSARYEADRIAKLYAGRLKSKGQQEVKKT